MTQTNVDGTTEVHYKFETLIWHVSTWNPWPRLEKGRYLLQFDDGSLLYTEVWGEDWMLPTEIPNEGQFIVAWCEAPRGFERVEWMPRPRVP